MGCVALFSQLKIVVLDFPRTFGQLKKRRKKETKVIRMRFWKFMLFIGIILNALSPVSHPYASDRYTGNIEQIKEKYPNIRIPVIDGDFPLVYEPDPENPNTWFVNDHCLIQGKDGKIHFFGIENPYPATKEVRELVNSEMEFGDRPFIITLWRMMHRHLYTDWSGKKITTHYRVGHAIADNIWGPWTRCEGALDGKKENKGYGSPFVVEFKNQYWMLLPSETGLALSDDLMNWNPIAANTSCNDLGNGHRDPCVVQLENGTFLQYYAGSDPQNRQVVNVARSEDLQTWERIDPCLVRDIPEASWSGMLESPYVLDYNGLYYLFVGFSHRHYYETFVVASDNPYHFEMNNLVTTIFSHAPEFIKIKGVTYMSSCGIEDPQALNHSGLWISQIRWVAP